MLRRNPFWARCKRKGKGSHRTMFKLIKWLSTAGGDGKIEMPGLPVSKMPPQIAEAQKITRAWMEKHPH